MKKNFQKGSSSGSFVKIKMNTEKLEEIRTAFLNGYVTRVGILGSKTNRTKGKTTNASIGLIHEKGSVSGKIPRRSFLEMPLILKSEDLLAVKDQIWKVFEGGPETTSRLRKAYKSLGIAAENIVQAAFRTGGFGNWKSLLPSTIKRKGSSAPLIDSGQLRRSITSDVVTK